MAVARRKRVLWFKFRDASRRMWRVFLVSRLRGPQGDLLGETDYDQRIVRIKYLADHSEMVTTLWHEWLHVACGFLDPNHKEHDLLFFSEESTIRRADRGIAAIARFMKYEPPPIPDEAARLAA